MSTESIWKLLMMMPVCALSFSKPTHSLCVGRLMSGARHDRLFTQAVLALAWVYPEHPTRSLIELLICDENAWKSMCTLTTTFWKKLVGEQPDLTTFVRLLETGGEEALNKELMNPSYGLPRGLAINVLTVVRSAGSCSFTCSWFFSCYAVFSHAVVCWSLVCHICLCVLSYVG